LTLPEKGYNKNFVPKKGLFCRNRTASNDCLPYEKSYNKFSLVFSMHGKIAKILLKNQTNIYHHIGYPNSIYFCKYLIINVLKQFFYDVQNKYQ
jgi:hypothetical protein